VRNWKGEKKGGRGVVGGVIGVEGRRWGLVAM